MHVVVMQLQNLRFKLAVTTVGLGPVLVYIRIETHIFAKMSARRQSKSHRFCRMFFGNNSFNACVVVDVLF